MVKSIVAASSLLLACTDRAPVSPRTASPESPTEAALAADVNAAVPSGLKSRLTFEVRTLAEVEHGHVNTFRVAVPSAWSASHPGFASVKPREESDTFHLIFMSVGTKCNGPCVAKDWAEASGEVDFNVAREQTVVKDELTPTHHLQVRTSNGAVELVFAWWTNGAPHYHVCTARLEDGLEAAVSAFETACRHARLLANPAP
jgi:hypothetical protein